MTPVNDGKVWYTAAELAEMRLSGLPATKRKINERALSEGWSLRYDSWGAPLARRRLARGGGTEYNIAVLPTSSRLDLVKRGIDGSVSVTLPIESRGGEWDWYAQQTGKTKSEAERRLKILQEVEALEASGLTRSASVGFVAAKAKQSGSTIWNWLSLVDGIAPADWLPAVAPRRRGGGSEAEVHPDVWTYIRSDYLRPEQPCWAECYRRAELVASSYGTTLPHAKTLWRKFTRDVPDQVIVLMREGMEKVIQMLPPQKRSVAGMAAMDCVNVDGHKFDVFVKWPDGRVGRAILVAIQDIMSRRFLAWKIVESESAVSVRLAFAELFRRYGIPKECVLDNGRGFASKWITGGVANRFRFKVKDEEPTGLLTQLNIKIHWALPFHGQSKPIERGFRDLCETIARHPAFAGAYTGNGVDAKPDNYGSKAIGVETFAVIADQLIKSHNARVGRRTEMALAEADPADRSFDRVFAKSYAASAIGKATDEQLRLALLTAADDIRCDPKSGAISVYGNRYWTEGLIQLAGEKVIVRFDPDDLTREVHVYHRDGRFLATAPIIAAVGFLDAASAKTHAKLKADFRKKTRELTKLEALLSPAQVSAMLPTYVDEAPAPSPAAHRIIRSRGQSAAALKLAPEASSEPLAPTQIDKLADAFERRLRLVED